MILEKLLEHIEREGKIDPTGSAEVSARYFYSARELVKERGLKTEDFDRELEKYTDIEKLLEIPEDEEFIDELVLIAANEIAREMLQEDREKFYTNLGQKAILRGLAESNGLFKLIGEITVKAIYRGTAILNKNFNHVTTMRVIKQHMGRRRIQIERYTKEEQKKKYERVFGKEGAQEILENNCMITRGVLTSASMVGEGKPATVYESSCEAKGGASCTYNIRWGKVKDPEKLEIRIRFERLKRRFMEVESQNAAYAEKIRRQERELSEREMEIAKQKLALLEQQKAALEKDAFLGRTARGYAHDIGNRLMAISGYVQMLEMYGEKLSSEKRAEYHKTISEVVDGTVELLTDFRNFVKKGKITYQPKNQGLTYLVDKSVRAFKGVAKERGIEIETEYLFEGQIAADHYKFPRILENLIKNAMDAMSDKGNKLIIRTYEEGGNACLEVEDNGPGIPRPIREHLFEAGVSGKGSSGLGMNIVKMLVELHEGTLEYTTNREGTTFKIRLPIAITEQEQELPEIKEYL